MGEPSLGTPQSQRPLEDRLDSWKEIAAHLDRDGPTLGEAGGDARSPPPARPDGLGLRVTC
jgi:hypothetical protein